MNVQELKQSNILSISLDQAHRVFEMIVSLPDDTRCKLMAWNDDGIELTVRIGALNLHYRADLGELEGISVVNNVLVMEGDFGDMEIEAANVVVEKLK
ncbi:hypothetical protein [Pseudomonas trivialis]|uniref:Uncharacterized protein n=1 Tax=Pseudomonas trivialis TaxID=200450 RepID=A0A0H5AJF8_9PSED|nr:hypothetical protein [Pseudomonas trivialis]AKS09820.1 hypothetical protein AA957_28125 [Pseudomonas trivialis]